MQAYCLPRDSKIRTQQKKIVALQRRNADLQKQCTELKGVLAETAQMLQQVTKAYKS